MYNSYGPSPTPRRHVCDTIETSPFAAGAQLADLRADFGWHLSGSSVDDELVKVLGGAVIYNANVIDVLLGKMGNGYTAPRLRMDDGAVIAKIVQRVLDDCKDDITVIGSSQNVTSRSATFQDPELTMCKSFVRFSYLFH